ncbi:MAG: ABC transporter permease [Alphaproteobacteria bacterium]|nr:MAG: ABC transporter permease [Alphaproteobacteria bacterium]
MTDVPVTAAEAEAAEVLSARPRTLWRDVWREFRKHRGAMIGTAVFILICLLVVVGPFIHTIDPTFTDYRARNAPYSWEHPLGTDNVGRDAFAQLLSGGRVSLAVGVAAMALSIFFGALVGILSGFFRRLDGPLMRLTDLFLALPLLPLLLVIIMLFRDVLRNLMGPEMGIFVLIVFVIGITSWMQTARIVRGEVLALREREFVLAAHSIGTRPRRILLRHILPNVLSPIMVSATLGIASAIITESALSFLGLGFPPDFPTWGRLIYDNKDFLQLAPERVLWPGLAVSLTVLSVNFMGDGLRDALDPRARGR